MALFPQPSDPALNLVGRFLRRPADFLRSRISRIEVTHQISSASIDAPVRPAKRAAN